MRSLLPVERECGVGATNLLEFFFLSLSSLYLSILEVEGDEDMVREQWGGLDWIGLRRV